MENEAQNTLPQVSRSTVNSLSDRHTPGEWVVQLIRYQDDPPMGFAVVSNSKRPDAKPIASVNCAGSKRYVLADYTSEELEANAALIASAPTLKAQRDKLYEALTATLTALRYMRDSDTQHWDFHVTPEICTAWDKAREALSLVEQEAK